MDVQVVDPPQPGGALSLFLIFDHDIIRKSGDNALFDGGSCCKIMPISCDHWSQCNLDLSYILLLFDIWMRVLVGVGGGMGACARVHTAYVWVGCDEWRAYVYNTVLDESVLLCPPNVCYILLCLWYIMPIRTALHCSQVLYTLDVNQPFPR